MLRLAFLLLALMVTATPFCNFTCFAAAVEGHRNPGSKSTALKRVHRRSVSARKASSPECRASDGGWRTCIYSDKTFCSINKNTGALDACHDASRCPAGVTGFKMVCDSTSEYCCCKGDPDRMACNDIWNQKTDTVWDQACKLTELSGLRRCKTSQTTPKPKFRCVSQEPNDTVRTDENCPDSRPFCGIDKQKGSALGCVSGSDCPPGLVGYQEGTFLCKNQQGKTGKYCCCKDDEGKPTRCNDLFNQEDNTAWRAACRKDELKVLWICQRSWTTTPRPPPTPPHPPPPFVTARNMSRHCLNYCIDNAPPGNLGPFDFWCGDPVPGQPTWNCPEPCPLGCDRYCPDGTNLKCPDLREPTSKPVGPTGPSGKSSTSTSASVLEPPGEPPFLDEEDKEGLPIAVIIGVVAVITVLAIAGVWFWLKRRPPVHPQSAPMMNNSAYSGQSGQPNSATSISSSPSANLSSSSSIQMAPQAQQKGGYPRPR